ncbi:heavy-metal-associated domain-containing protein [Candidatus Poribacteria bacterium]|nr:heavy-metal-associated domain-containing protein [Candidatus Poribacteria bacterium]
MGDKRVTLPIGGMTCAACARKVENALRGVKGTGEVNVNLTSR